MSLHNWHLRLTATALVAMLCALLIQPLAQTVRAQEAPELQITSTNYIVIDADTGEIFAQRGANERRAPASLTKIFTAIETIEEAAPEIPLTTSDADMVSSEASQVGFGPDETFTVRELLYGMMLPSGNDAARTLARNLGAQEGDSAEQATQRFLDRLNQRLLNMGLTNTHLVNPDGWGVPGHYSSPYDLAAFTMYALHYPRFVQTFSTGTYESDNGEYIFKNNNRMLKTYDGIIGGKTGYDDDAGWCLVNVAERDGRRMIAVTMNGVAPDDWYDDNRVLLNYGFEQQALKAANGTLGTGEFVRFRDPDAALILTMAKASGSVGAEIGPPATTTQQITSAEPLAVDAAAPAAAIQAKANTTSAPIVEAVLAAPPQPGVGGNAIAISGAIAAVLIALHALSTWRLLTPTSPTGSREASVAGSD